MITVAFREEDNATPVRSDHLRVKVLPYTNSAEIGHDVAELEIEGAEQDLFDVLYNWLRYGVILTHKHHGEVWAGFILTAQLSIPRLGETRTHDLTDMANRIKVIYQDAKGVRKETAWGEDTTLIARYSKKELIIASDTITESAAANNRRDTELARRKYPIESREYSTPDPEGTTVLTLRLVGWQELANWIMYIQTGGDEGHTPEGVTWYKAFGWGRVPPTTPHISWIAQRFRLADSVGFQALKLQVLLAKNGTPGNAVYQLCADSAGVPGAVLDTCTIAPADVPQFSNNDYVEGSFTTNYDLQTGVDYWLKASKSNANDSVSQYYWYCDNQLRYSRGIAINFYNNGQKYLIVGDPAAPNATHATTAATAKTGTNADFCFRIIGGWTTLKRIQQLIAAVAGLTIDTTAMVSPATATKLSYPERTGETSALEDLLDYLREGTDDQRKIQTKTGSNRVMRVFPEPLQAAYAYKVIGRQLYDRYEQPVSWAICPAGAWLFFPDAVPIGVQVGSLTRDPRYQFLESCSYDPETDFISGARWRGQPDEWSLFEE